MGLLSWYCARCGDKCSSLDAAKNSSKNESLLSDFAVPNDKYICNMCLWYLENDDFIRSREESDSGYSEDEERGEEHISYKESKYNPSCREFDIEYGFYDEETDCYYDEEPEDDDDEYDSSEYDEEENNEDEYEEEDELSFVEDANDIVLEELHQDQNKALFKTLTNTSNNDYKTVFASTMQSYLVHIALIISNVASKKLEGKKFLPECLNYLCNTILEGNDSTLYKKLVKVNPPANDVKHDNKKIEIDIKEYLKYYNKLIKKIIEKTDLDAFEICYISTTKQNTKTSIIICHICGHANIQDYYLCPSCKNITCPDCYNKQNKMCEKCYNEK